VSRKTAESYCLPASRAFFAGGLGLLLDRASLPASIAHASAANPAKALGHKADGDS
jgi:hypothetical protein